MHSRNPADSDYVLYVGVNCRCAAFIGNIHSLTHVEPVILLIMYSRFSSLDSLNTMMVPIVSNGVIKCSGIPKTFSPEALSQGLRHNGLRKSFQSSSLVTRRNLIAVGRSIWVYVGCHICTDVTDALLRAPRLRNDLYCVEWDLNSTIHLCVISEKKLAPPTRYCFSSLLEIIRYVIRFDRTSC